MSSIEVSTTICFRKNYRFLYLFVSIFLIILKNIWIFNFDLFKVQNRSIWFSIKNDKNCPQSLKSKYCFDYLSCKYIHTHTKIKKQQHNIIKSILSSPTQILKCEVLNEYDSWISKVYYLSLILKLFFTLKITKKI